MLLLFFFFQSIFKSDYNITDNLLGKKHFNFVYIESKHDYWIATSDKGWTHFNNGKVKHYEISNPHAGLKGSWIQSKLYKASNGDLYGCSDQYIVQYNKASDKFNSFRIKYNGQDLKEEYHLIGLDKTRKQLILKADKMIVLYDIAEQKIKKVVTTNTSSVRYDYNAENGTILGCPWILDTGFDIYTIDKNGEYSQRHLHDNVVLNGKDHKINFSHVVRYQDHHYLSTNKGLFRYNLISNKLTQFLHPQLKDISLKDLLLHKDQLIILLQNNQIYYFNLLKNEYNSKLEINSDLISDIDDINLDEANSRLFINDSKQGLVQLNLELLKTELQKVIPNMNSISIITKWKEKIVFKNNKSVILYNPKNGSLSNLNKFLKNINIEEIIKINGEGDLLGLATTGSFLALDSNYVIKYHTNKFEKSKLIELDHLNAETYIVTSLKKYYQIDIKNKKNIVEYDNEEKEKYKFTQQSGKLYYYDHYGQLFLEDGSKKDSLIFKDKFIYNIIKGSNSFYLSSTSGVYQIKDNRVNPILREIHEKSTINHLVLDEQGTLWLTYDDGIGYIKDGNIIRLPIQKSNDLANLNPVIIGSDIYFVRDNALWKMPIKEKLIFTNAPELFVNFLYQDRISVTKERMLDIAHNVNKIGFSFVAHDDYEHKTTHLKYRIAALDRIDWHYTNDTLIEFSHLPAGKYELEVVAQGSNNVWSEIMKIPFGINAPFWQNKWFILLLCILLPAMGFAVNNSMTQYKLKQKEIELKTIRALSEQKDRISQDLHDEIGGGLAKIKILAHANQDQTKTDVANLASNLMDNMRDMLWSMDQSNDTIQSLTTKIRIASNHLLDGTSMHLKINTNVNGELPISGEARRHVISIVKEAITNIIKHAHATEVKIAITTLNDKQIEIEIEDNGIGLKNAEVAENTAHYGMNSMQKRAKELQGNLTILPKEKGLCIRLTIPLPYN